MGSMGGMESRRQVWAGKVERSVSHPDGLAGSFLRSPVFRGHFHFDEQQSETFLLHWTTHTWMSHLQFLSLVLMPLPEECLLICLNPYRSILIIFRH